MPRFYCEYNNGRYSPGSIVCQSGRQMICRLDGNQEGFWNDNGLNCSADAVFENDEIIIRHDVERARTNNAVVTVDYSDSIKVRFRSTEPCQFTLKNFNTGATRTFRIVDKRVVRLDQYPRLAGEPGAKAVWDISDVTALDPSWGTDVISSLHTEYTGPMLWVYGNLQAYTVLDIEYRSPTVRKEVKIIPPGVKRYLGSSTSDGTISTTIRSAHLDSDYITNIDVTLV